MMRQVLCGVALLALGLLAPSAAAHAAFDGGSMLGEASAHVELTGAPIPAALVPMDLAVRTDATGAQLRLVSPSGQAGAWEDVADGSVVPVVFAGPGVWSIELRAGEHRMSLDVNVWPRAGAFVEPGSDVAREGIGIVGDIDFRARLVDASGAPIAPPADVRARVLTPDGPVEAPVEVDGEAIVVTRAWTQGEHRIEILSATLGLVPDARPTLGLLVVPAEGASVYGLEAAPSDPGPAWGLVALAVLIAAAAFTTARLWRRSCSR